MNTTLLTEVQLVRALQTGQKADFTTLYDAYAPALFGVIIRLVNDQERAEDLLQDTFIKVWTHRQHYDSKQGRLYTWLITIARNVALDELRSRKVQSVAYSLERNNDHSYLSSTEGLPNGSVFNLIPSQYRQVVELAYTQQRTHQEIAQELDLPLGTVKTRIRTALRELKQFFRQDIAYYHA